MFPWLREEATRLVQVFREICEKIKVQRVQLIKSFQKHTKTQECQYLSEQDFKLLTLKIVPES